MIAAAFTLTQAGATSASQPEIPFQFRDGLIWVRVSAARSVQPLNFLLDTGASVSVINLRTAKRLGFKSGTRVSVRGVRNSVIGHRPVRLHGKAADVPLPRDFLEADLSRLSQACAATVDGLIGVDFFRERVVQIDFTAEKIRLLKSDRHPRGGQILPLELRRCGIRLPVSVNGGNQQWVRLDTGCASALQWVTETVQPEKCARQMAVGLAEISVPQVSTRVQIGTATFDGVPTGLHEKEIFAGEAGLLGNGLLCRFSSVTIDAKASRLILQSQPVDP